MSGDNMQRFITVLMKWGIGFAVLLAVLLLLVGIALIWWPEILAEILRVGVAILCFVGGAWILVSLLIGVCKRK